MPLHPPPPKKEAKTYLQINKQVNGTYMFSRESVYKYVTNMKKTLIYFILLI